MLALVQVWVSRVGNEHSGTEFGLDTVLRNRGSAAFWSAMFHGCLCSRHKERCLWLASGVRCGMQRNRVMKLRSRESD